MSKVEVDQVDPQSGTTLTLGTSGDTVSIPSGVTLANAGTVTGIPASAISSGTIATARLGSGTASSSTFLRGDQTYATPAGGGGKVLQVISSTNSYQKSTSSTSFVDVESSSGVVWETAITPSATSSKILILASLPINITGSSNQDNRTYSNVSGKVGSGSYTPLVNYQRTGTYTYGSYYASTSAVVPFNYLWTSNTTSECKIKFQFSSYTSTNATVYVPALSSQLIVVTLMEIGA